MNLLIFLTATLLVTFTCGTPLNNEVGLKDYLNVRPRFRRAFFDDIDNEDQFDDRRNKTLLCDELKLKTGSYFFIQFSLTDGLAYSNK